MEMIEAHLYALNKTQLSKEAQIPRSTIYKAIRGGNPTLKTVARLIHCSSE